MKLPRTAVTAAAVTAALLTAGAAYAATAGTPTATKTDTIVTTTGIKSLSAEGGTRTTIIRINLPRGAYVLDASGDLVNFGPSDYTRCQISVAGTQVAAVSTLVGDPAASDAQGAAALVAPFALTGGVIVTRANAQAILRCSHDDTNGATPYVDSNVSLWAHKTSALKTATQ